MDALSCQTYTSGIMKILRRRVRSSFLFAAIGFLVIGIADIAHQNFAHFGVSALRHYGFIAFCLAQGSLYAAAWFTTRTPSPYRNDWAVAASVFTLAYSAYDLWLNHADILNARGGLIGLVLAIAGLYVFASGGAPADSKAESEFNAVPEAKLSLAASQHASAAPSEGVASRRSPDQPRVAVRAFRVPADASASTASSTALAAAAASPHDPNENRWDPVSFIRTAAPLPASRS